MQSDVEQTLESVLPNGSIVDGEKSEYVDVAKPTDELLLQSSTIIDQVVSSCNAISESGTESNLSNSASLVPNGDGVMSKKSKRVKFPENDKVVQSYLNPPDPWKHGKTCSTDALIQAYCSACERFNVKPITKLIQQLHTITNFLERNDTLTLRGEKVDQKQVETLEEIFKRVQFRTLDLENTYLEEEGAIALFDMVEYYESAIRLNISGNRTIGFRGWQACSRMIKRTPSLIHLEAKGCLLIESNVGFLSRPIRMGCFLKVLHLENTNMSGKSLIILGTALKMNDTLSELYLGENKLVASDSIQLGNILKHNNSLTLLDVRNNSLQDVGVAHLCEGLCEQSSSDRGLKTLVLFNNQLTYQAMSSIAKVLLITNHLASLNVGHNSITNEGIHRLKESLLANKTITNLGFQSARISCEGAVALAEYIAESRFLMHMDLRENEIKTAGLMALSLSLKVNQSVTQVDLDKDPKREGMKDYADQQRRLLQDIIKYTMRNTELLRQNEFSETERHHLLEQEVENGRTVNGISAQQQIGRFDVIAGSKLEGDRQRLLEEEVESVCAAKNTQDATPAVLPAHLSARDRLRLTIPTRSILRDLASPPGVPVANLMGVAFEAPPDSPQIIPPSNVADMASNPSDVLSPSSPFFVPTNFPLSPMMSCSGHPILTPFPLNSGDTTPSALSPLESSWIDEVGQIAESVNSASKSVSEIDEGYVNPLFLLSEEGKEDSFDFAVLQAKFASRDALCENKDILSTTSELQSFSAAVADNDEMNKKEKNCNAVTDINTVNEKNIADNLEVLAIEDMAELLLSPTSEPEKMTQPYENHSEIVKATSIIAEENKAASNELVKLDETKEAIVVLQTNASVSGIASNDGCAVIVQSKCSINEEVNVDMLDLSSELNELHSVDNTSAIDNAVNIVMQRDDLPIKLDENNDVVVSNIVENVATISHDCGHSENHNSDQTHVTNVVSSDEFVGQFVEFGNSTKIADEKELENLSSVNSAHSKDCAAEINITVDADALLINRSIASDDQMTTRHVKYDEIKSLKFQGANTLSDEINVEDFEPLPADYLTTEPALSSNASVSHESFKSDVENSCTANVVLEDKAEKFGDITDKLTTIENIPLNGLQHEIIVHSTSVVQLREKLLETPENKVRPFAFCRDSEELTEDVARDTSEGLLVNSDHTNSL